MNDNLLENTLFRKILRMLYVSMWTSLIIFSLYYTDLGKYGCNILNKVFQFGDVNIVNRVNKLLLPISIAMMLFWIDLIYQQALNIYNTNKSELSVSFLFGFYVVGIVAIVLTSSSRGLFYIMMGIFVIFSIIKWVKTPLIPNKPINSGYQLVVFKPTTTNL